MFRITVHGQSISCQCDVCATDSIDYLKCAFFFSQDWNGLVKTAQFSQNGTTYSVAITDDMCLLPAEIGEGEFDISVFGQLPGKTLRITTLSVRANMKKSGFVPDGQTPIPPTADLYSQLIEKLEDTVEAIPKKLSEFENDTDFAEKSDIPTRVSQLENDAGYIENNGKIHESVSAVSGGYIQFNTHMQASNTANVIKISSSGVNISSEYGGVHISDVSTPTEDTDAANKKYVDDVIPDIPTKVSAFVNDAGYIKNNVHEVADVRISAIDTMSLGSQYGNMTINSSHGNVSIYTTGSGNVKISNLIDPTNDSDAVNKGYVDGLVGDIETALDGIIAYQNSLTGGETV